MNDQTVKFLETLAQKLGTTSQYLWGVLIKQAPIDATITLCQTIAILLFGWGLWKAHKRLIKTDDTAKYSKSLYSKYEEGAVIPMIILTLLFVILICCSFFSVGDIVNGYLNPEYWALDHILNSCKE